MKHATTYTLGLPPCQTRVTFVWRTETVLTYAAERLTSETMASMDVAARMADLLARGYALEARRGEREAAA